MAVVASFKDVEELRDYILRSRIWFAAEELYKDRRSMVSLMLNNDTFWELWRSEKERIKEVGFRVAKDAGGDWAIFYKRVLPHFCQKIGDYDKAVNLKDKKLSDLLFDYQRPQSLSLLKSLQKNGLFIDGSDAGVGKTIVALAAVKELGLKPLIVCRKSGKSVWSFWANYLGVELIDTVHYQELKTGKSRYLIKDSAEDRSGHKQYFFKWKISSEKTIIIFDEVHQCKNFETQNSELLTSAYNQGYFLGLISATLVESPLQFNVFGYVIGEIGFPVGKAFEKWALQHGCFHEDIWIKKNGKAKQIQVLRFNSGNTGALQELNQIIYPKFGGRISIPDLGDRFPEQQISAVPYFMDNAEKINKLYADLERDILEIKKRKDDAKEILPILSLARQEIELMKLPTVLEVVTEYLEAGKSIAVFVNFKKSLFYLADELKSDCVVHGDQIGKKGDLAREKAISNFQSDKSRVIILTGASGGESISLHDVTGQYPRVGLISPSWNAVEFVQILGRVYRSGSKSSVLQRLLFAAETIEEDVARLVMAKADQIKMINDGDLMGRFGEYLK